MFIYSDLDSFEETISCSDSDNRATALQEELKSMKNNDLWDPVGLPHNKLIGCK